MNVPLLSLFSTEMLPGVISPDTIVPAIVPGIATRFLATTSGLNLPIDPTLSNQLTSIVGAIAILIIGWLIAVIAAGITRGIFKRTDLDDRLARMVAGSQATNLNIDKWASTIVFWLIFVIALVAFLNALNLTAASEPLNNFLNQVFSYLPKLGSAILLIVIAWLIATIARAVIIRLAQSLSLDQRLTQADPSAAPEGQFLVSTTLGNALYWFVFLFFLPLILGVLELRGPLEPVQNLLNNFLSALPRIVEAIVIGVVGWFIARVVRGIVTNLLAATGTDALGVRLGLRPTRGGLSLSGIIGTVVYVLILIPTAIAALDALQIAAITLPATAMLNQILNTLPQIFTAVLILIVAYVVGQFVADLISNILTGIGFNNIFTWLGLPAPVPAPAPAPVSTEVPVVDGQPVPPPSRTPSEIVGTIALVGIMLFAIVAATNILNIPALTTIISGILLIFGRVLVGLVVFAVGLYLANLVFTLTASSQGRQARILGQTARIAIIALASAMALQQMGIATDIVNLAFGLLLGALAVAIALAFGLGGRDIAAEQIREWLATFKRPY